MIPKASNACEWNTRPDLCCLNIGEKQDNVHSSHLYFTSYTPFLNPGVLNIKKTNSKYTTNILNIVDHCGVF